jgi:ribokinase
VSSNTALVVGSINLDVIWAVGHLPVAGETVLSTGSARGLGGKGGNQAAAIRALEVPTTLVGAVGEDEAGDWLLDQLARRGVTATAVRRAAGTSGQAQVVVGKDTGDNLIVVLPGANTAVSPADVEAAMTWDRSELVVAQQEVSQETVAATLRHAALDGRRAVLNAAPARDLPDELLAQVGVLVVNEGEACALAGCGDSREAATALRSRGATAVVVSLGAAGAILDDGDGPEAFPVTDISTVVDTTLAGDILVGALAASLVWGRPMREAVRIAVRASSWSVQHAGVRIPDLTDLGLRW